ncbi:MAG: peptide chain release factor 2 [Alphaproteobacteria bacterium]|nr:peptide chain release factor 2 [Alphaproteobacteria bacterium]
MCSGGRFEKQNAFNRLKELEESSLSSNFWDDQKNAQKVMKEKSLVEAKVNNYNKSKQEASDLYELFELAKLEQDESAKEDIATSMLSLAAKLKKDEIECLFSGEVDSNDCFIDINAGAGGTESHDWALMLMRMYLRWAEKRGFKTEVVDELDGEEAGIKSATIKVSGMFAYGWCKSESGVHRLVRISPFNAAGKRQTSFASIWVYPLITDAVEVEINEKDLRIDTYRASGAGGQHINKTDSAVRITHLPTNIVVQCQSDRSQHKNKAACMDMLKSRLYELELKKREETINSLSATKTDNSWGHQIRSYVLQPYQMVKDLRTDYETSDTSGVLDGDIDNFMSSYLKSLVTN